MRLHDFGIIVLVALAITWFGMSKHNTGFDHAYYVKDAPACELLYVSIPAKMDADWAWTLPTVQEQTQLLASLIEYKGEPVGCSADGKWLYTKDI